MLNLQEHIKLLVRKRRHDVSSRLCSLPAASAAHNIVSNRLPDSKKRKGCFSRGHNPSRSCARRRDQLSIDSVVSRTRSRRPVPVAVHSVFTRHLLCPQLLIT